MTAKNYLLSDRSKLTSQFLLNAFVDFIHKIHCRVAAGLALDTLQPALSDHTTGTAIHDAAAHWLLVLAVSAVGHGYRLTDPS